MLQPSVKMALNIRGCALTLAHEAHTGAMTDGACLLWPAWPSLIMTRKPLPKTESNSQPRVVAQIQMLRSPKTLNPKP